MQATDTSAIQRLIGRARVRIRSQWALEGATTAVILAAAAALVSIFALRMELISRGACIALLVASASLIVIGAIVRAMRPIDDETIARRIDRASNLADRLSTAIAFGRALRASSGAPAEADAETEDLMLAAIRDGVRAVPRANVEAAAPYRLPKDLRAAAAFLAVSALAAGLAIPRPDRTPRLTGVDPPEARPGEVVKLQGVNLLTGIASPVASRQAHNVIGAPGAAAVTGTGQGFVPADGTVYLGPAEGGRPVSVIDWSKTTITIKIPDDAAPGDTLLTAYIGKQKLGPVPFTVVSLKDVRYQKADSVVLDPDERAYVEAILAQLKQVAERDKVPELEDFVSKIEKLLKDAEDGKISKEKLLEELAKAENAMNDKADPDQKQIDDALKNLGDELAKEQVTKPLGEALKQNNLEKAKQEMEKLALKLDKEALENEKKDLEQKLDNKDLSPQEKQDLQKKLDDLKQEQPLSEKEKDQLGKKLDQVAKQMDKQDKDGKQKQETAQKQMEDEVRKLEKKKEQAKTDKDKLDAERQLQKKKDELKKLQKDEQDKEQSTQREALKRLQRDLEKTAESLDKPKPDPNKDKDQQDQEQQERDRQASRNMKDAARETGRVDQDQRKQATQKKMSSQMDDLREAMRRAKQKGNKGPQDPFGKNGKNKDFAQRSRGGKGNGGAWKPGQGQGPGQKPGQGQPGGQGDQPGGSEWGTGHDDNLTGDPTQKSGNQKDQDLQGQQGSKGSSRRETILAAAQKGFAGVGYKKVYADYERIVEEVMRTEKLPSSYKYYVKRYFAKIHPSTASAGTDLGADSLPAPVENQ